MVLAVRYFTLNADFAQHKILCKHIFNIRIDLAYTIYLSHHTNPAAATFIVLLHKCSLFKCDCSGFGLCRHHYLHKLCQHPVYKRRRTVAAVNFGKLYRLVNCYAGWNVILILDFIYSQTD